MRLLEEDLHERPTVTYENRAQLLHRLVGIEVSKATICRATKQMGYTRKRSVGATERDEWKRTAWRMMVAEKLDPTRLVFVDEMVPILRLLPSLYTYSPKGQRAYAQVPGNRGPNTTLLLSMTM